MFHEAVQGLRRIASGFRRDLAMGLPVSLVKHSLAEGKSGLDIRLEGHIYMAWRIRRQENLGTKIWYGWKHTGEQQKSMTRQTDDDEVSERI